MIKVKLILARGYKTWDVIYNGNWIGIIRQSSYHMRGRETNKSIHFTPKEASGLRYMSEAGWTLRPLLTRIEKQAKTLIKD